MSNPVFITGMPYGGSQLLAGLVDGLPDAVCLNHLPEQWEFAKRQMNGESYAKWLIGDAQWQRQRIIDKQIVLDFRHADGSAWLDRYDLSNQQPQRAGRPLSENGIIAMHNTTIFTAVLPALSLLPARLFAVVRHPLVQCRLWRAKPACLPTPGKPPGIVRFWPEPVTIWQGDAPEAYRMAQVYETFLGRYHDLGKKLTLLRHEDLIEKPVFVSDAFDADVLPAQSEKLEKLPRESTTPKDAFEEELMRNITRHGVYAKLYYRV